VLTVRYCVLGLRAGERVLDLGAGGGRHAFEAMRRGGDVVALDADAGEIKQVACMMAGLMEQDPKVRAACGRGQAVRADATALPFRSGAFARAIAAEVLEHVVDDQAAISELARVLEPGGALAVTVPRFWPELLTWSISDEYHLVPGGHVRIYRRALLRRRLEARGLKVYASHHAHALHSPYWWLKATVGVGNDSHPLVRAYHRLLVWDITKAPVLTRALERLLNPLLGKSLVVYTKKAP